MKYQHPTITISEPAPGHFVISGHAPGATFVEGVGHVVPPLETFIPPQVPSEALLAILDERGDKPETFALELEAVSGELEEVRAENTKLREELIAAQDSLNNAHKKGHK